VDVGLFRLDTAVQTLRLAVRALKMLMTITSSALALTSATRMPAR